MKNIDTGSLAYSSLKQISRDDVPIGLGDDTDLEGGGRPFPAFSGEEVRYSNGSEFNQSLESSRRSFRFNLLYLLSKKEVVSSVIMYGVDAFAVTISAELFPLWVVTDRDNGGFGYSMADIGLTIMVCGAVGVVVQSTVYPYITEKVGVMSSFRWGSFLFCLAAILFPTTSSFSGPSKEVEWLAVLFFQLCLTVSVNWVLVSLFVLINNSCYSHQRATVNGIGQTCASIGRLLGPYVLLLIFILYIQYMHIHIKII